MAEKPGFSPDDGRSDDGAEGYFGGRIGACLGKTLDAAEGFPALH